MIESESSSSDSADLEEPASSMTRELNNYQLLRVTHEKGTKLCLISKVPQHIYEFNSNAFKPIVMAIGPYHHGTRELLTMEKVKWNCLSYVLGLNRERDLENYVTAVEELALQVRNCYSGEITIENNKFIQMLLLDGCFILVALCATDGIAASLPEVYDGNADCQEITAEYGIGRDGEPRSMKNKIVMSDSTTEKSMLEVEPSRVDSQYRIRNCGIDIEYGQNYSSDQMGLWYTNFLAHDLLLLENQIPFILVKRIYELVLGNNVVIPSLTDKIAGFIEDILIHYPKSILESDRPKDFNHLLHLCHMYFKPCRGTEGDSHQQQAKPRFFHRFLHLDHKYFEVDCLPAGQLRRWRRAVHYHEAGVVFTRKELDKEHPHSLLDIRFSNGVVEIPCLLIDENTDSLFRNLIAFEQTCPQFGNNFTAYIFFMSQLISMPADATLLVQRGIVVHQLHRDEDVSTLFTKLNKDVVFDFNGDYYLKLMSSALEAHYQSRLNRWVAWLRNNHCSNPWLGLGVLAATVVLFCTLVQTLIAVLSYINPP
ncbi:UPF0481 protein [Ananas comosus]|uniref:UPF0481 protein n=1 Tax=Ananas comosus TaxID=4615 RepID=A0A199VJ38_ANACO|nr:UPF0481 protein [Ananas comosus]